MTHGSVVARLAGATVACLACGLTCWALARGAVHTGRGQRLDQLVLTAAQNDQGPMTRIVAPVLNTVTLPVIVVALLVAAVLAVLQRHTSMAVHLVVLVAGAALSTQAVKLLVMDRPVLASGLDVTPNSFPSGHATLAAAIAVALTLASPRRFRGPVAVLGAAWTAIAGIGTIAGGWHRPSDVLGALLIVGAWAFLVLAADAALTLARRRAGDGTCTDGTEDEAPRRSEARVATAVLGSAAVLGLLVGALLLARIPTPLHLGSASSQATAYSATIAVVGGVTCALIAGTLLAHVPTVPSRRETVRVR